MCFEIAGSVISKGAASSLTVAEPLARRAKIARRVEFASATEGEEIAFAVRDAKRQTPHLDGRVRPLKPKPNANTGRKSK